MFRASLTMMLATHPFAVAVQERNTKEEVVGELRR
jgi:hypothetical protein